MNPYRCGTCKHKQIAPKYVSEMNGSNWQCKIGNDKRDLTPERQIIISERCCTSHSDFQSEREKVLDNLEAWVKENYFKYVENCEVKYCAGGLLEKITELRNEGTVVEK